MAYSFCVAQFLMKLKCKFSLNNLQAGTTSFAPASQMRDQKLVLSRRRGRLLTRRTILKSYLFRPPPPLAGQPQVRLVEFICMDCKSEVQSFYAAVRTK
jgi:hypothetical protein